MSNAPTTPRTAPIPISTTNSRAITPLDASAWVASSIIPIMSAMPAGSLKPASPSRVTPERPSISFGPRTENMVQDKESPHWREETPTMPDEPPAVAAPTAPVVGR